LQKQAFDKIIAVSDVVSEKMLQSSAGTLYEHHLREKIFRIWQGFLVSARKVENRTDDPNLVTKFLLLSSAQCLSSERQVISVKMTKVVYRRSLLVPSWAAFIYDRYCALRAEAKIPMASRHFKKVFNFRLLSLCLGALAKHTRGRKVKNANLIVAYQFRHIFLYSNGFIPLRIHFRQAQRNRRATKLASGFILSRLLGLSVAYRFMSNAKFNSWERNATLLATRLNDGKLVRNGFTMLKHGCVWSKEWRRLSLTSIRKFRSKMNAKYWELWSKHHFVCRNMDMFLLSRYQTLVKRSVLNALRSVVFEKQDYLTKMIGGGNDSQDLVTRVLAGVCRLQAQYRAVSTRKNVDEFMVASQYSRQILQNFGRRALSLLRIRSLQRKNTHVVVISEEKEREYMARSEKETLYFKYHDDSVVSIQRYYRGYHGRLHSLDVAKAKRLENAFTDNYTVQKLKGEYLYNIEHQNIINMERNKAACEIQKIVRGLLARKVFTTKIEEYKRRKSSVIIQKYYRRRLCMQQKVGLMRDLVSKHRFRAALRQRSLLLRLMGLLGRQKQLFVSRVALNALGFDPLLFNYRPQELAGEMIDDAILVMKSLRREKDLFLEVKGQQILTTAGRRKWAEEQNYSFRIHDAVKVIDPGHQFVGSTGSVVRIDASIPGQPLYDIKLDAMNSGVTYVMMTTDALMSFLHPQPLSKIKETPSIHHLGPLRRMEIYGLYPDDPFHDGNNIDAAWVIQRAWRVHRSHHITARKRFEAWVRIYDAQATYLRTLSGSNCLNVHGHLFSGWLSLKPGRRIYFDEIRHVITPSTGSLKNANEKVELRAILVEVDEKMKERQLILAKAHLLSSKELFASGHSRLTLYRRFILFAKLKLGGGEPKANNKYSKLGIFGMDKYFFAQFASSPHVRYHRMSIYQGKWKGIPLVTRTRPHGEGIICFLDGWGYAKEDKTLFVEILRCRYLNAADLTTSDPYCEILCNGRRLQTTVKWANLNPIYNEKFEIDVSNPGAFLTIKVFDYDYIGSHDFLGQVVIPLSELSDGNERHELILLGGENVGVEEGFDRGEIELKLRWAEQIFDDDILTRMDNNEKAIQLQAWIRKCLARSLRSRVNKENDIFTKLVEQNSVKIQGQMRIVLAKKILKILRKRWRTARKIQKRVRIWIARKVVVKKRTEKAAAIIIQSIGRGFTGRRRYQNFLIRREKEHTKSAITIQKYIRRRLSISIVARIMSQVQATGNFLNLDDDENSTGLSWILTYGRDLEYGSKRLKRMTHRIFNRIISTKFAQLQSKFGVVYIDCHPPNTIMNSDKLDVRPEEFVQVFLPKIDPVYLHREDIIRACGTGDIYALSSLHIATSIFLRPSVQAYAIIIQCFVRQKVARRKFKFMQMISDVIARFQHIFRRKYAKSHLAASRIISLFYMIKAKHILTTQKAENYSIKTIQSAVRIWIAQCKLLERRCLRGVKILKDDKFGHVRFHGPEKMVDFKRNTFWMSNTWDQVEVRFEFPFLDSINEVQIMLGTHSATPRRISIAAVKNKSSKSYHTLVQDYEFVEKGLLWHTFKFESIITKYFKLRFDENFGDENSLAVRQVRFVRSREQSVVISTQPHNLILSDGPLIGARQPKNLICEAVSWPLPKFQWFRNGSKMRYANNSILNLVLLCPVDRGKRSFRCGSCKMVAFSVPLNAYHVRCANCFVHFDYKEIQHFEDKLALLREDERKLAKEHKKIHEILIQMEYSEGSSIRENMKIFVEQLNELQQRLDRCRQGLCVLKAETKHVNLYKDEGVYHCEVSNVRGGSIRIKRISNSATVFICRPQRYLLRVQPNYKSRIQMFRKAWTIYSSLQGFFRNGKIEGIVTIRFLDKSTYEGPYVPEEFLDSTGKVFPSARIKNHQGRFCCTDGTIFEGELVDNHFDPRNIQLYYRMILPDGGVYEGSFCDEQMHGVGSFRWMDGSMYEGEWFRGKRFGYGHMKDVKDKSCYEGWWDSDKIHGDGIMSWEEGNIYLGQWKYGEIHGIGIYISLLKDCYKGEFANGVYHGKGSLMYSNGSRYDGDFQHGKRHGRGLFMADNGDEFYGSWKDDQRIGEHICKLIVSIEESGQDCFEIKVGLFANGRLTEWKSKFANELTTKRFIRLFNEDREMFDSVFSLILAKNLPNVPAGVDPDHKGVQHIVRQLSKESGLLVGKTARVTARSKLGFLVKPLKDLKSEVEDTTNSLDAVNIQILENEKKRFQLWSQYTKLIFEADREHQRIEQYFLDDPQERRHKFERVVNALDIIQKDDWFKFKNHRFPPPFTKKIMDAISFLLKLAKEWPLQQILLSDNVYTAREGDDTGLRFEYKAKIVYLMKNYNVFDFCDVDLFGKQSQLSTILADSRFHRDSYYIRSTGIPGPYLVDLVKTNFQFLHFANSLVHRKLKGDVTMTDAFRLKASHAKLTDEAGALQNLGTKKRTELETLTLQLYDQEKAFIHAKEMIDFVEDNLKSHREVSAKPDVYELFEHHVESNLDLFAVETSVEQMIQNTEITAENKMEHDFHIRVPNLRQQFESHVQESQKSCVASGYSLGFTLDEKDKVVPESTVNDAICGIVKEVVSEVNEVLNDTATSTKWTMLNGRTITTKTFYVMAWTVWKAMGIEKEERAACIAWEAIFGKSNGGLTPAGSSNCARSALEAGVNSHMSEVARAQAIIWTKRNASAVLNQEIVLSDEFERKHESEEDLASFALVITKKNPHNLPSLDVARAMCWLRLHPEETEKARNEEQICRANEFADFFGASSPEIAVNIIDGLEEVDEDTKYNAIQWKALNISEFQEAEKAILEKNARDFSRTYPVETGTEAARIILNDNLSNFVMDNATKAELIQTETDLLFARSWMVNNQGKFKDAQESLYADLGATANRLWNDFISQTEQFSTGINSENRSGEINGFRDRLKNKTSWMFAYISLQNHNFTRELDNIETNNPMLRIYHNIRPSEHVTALNRIEGEYVKRRKFILDGQITTAEKIRIWLDYFKVCR
jgi:hypothetical protein